MTDLEAELHEARKLLADGLGYIRELDLKTSHPGACSSETDCDMSCADHGWWRHHIQCVEAFLRKHEEKKR